MRKLYFHFSILLLSIFVFQTTTAGNLHPEAATIWDAYFPDGGHRANSDRLFPVIPTIGYNSEATSCSFYFDTDVALLQPGITALHNRGMKYYMFQEFYVLEVDVNDLLATDPLLPDADFGLTYKLDGSKSSSTRSINRPDYFNFVLRCIKRGIDAGADGIQFDMAGEEFLDSFDPDDVSAFVDYMKANHPSSVWTSEGIDDIDTLDYRAWLYNYKGITDFPITFDENSSTPLARYWLLFKIQRIQDSWKALSDSTKAYAQINYGRDFTIIGNNYHFGTMGQHGIQTMGDVCGEYFSYSDTYPLQGTTTTRHKAFQGIGKRDLIWSTPDYVGDPCNCDNEEFDLHMVAESFASGGLAQFAGEKNERNGYAKYFNLVQTQRDLLNSVTPTGEVGVILAMPTTVCAWGSMDNNYGAQLLMQDLGRSYEVVIGGTDLGWPDSLKLSDLTKFKMVVLHEGIFLTDNQVDVLRNYVNQGGNLMVFGTGLSPGWTGAQNENGADRINPIWQNLVTGSTRISNHGTGKVAFIKELDDPNDGNCRTYFRNVNSRDSAKNAIARDIINTVRIYTDLLIEKENIRVDMSDKVTIFRSEDAENNTMLYHLVNHDVDSITRLHNTFLNKNVKLALMDSLITADSVYVTLYNPDIPQGIELGNIVVDSGRVNITVPELFIWEMIKISNKQTGDAVKAKQLTITNAIDNFKLSYNGEPEFSWVDVNENQEKYQLQVWSNAICYGTPLYDSGWITSSDTTFNYSEGNLTEGQSCFTRLRIKSAVNDTSEWTNTTFHINKRPTAPNHNYGISASIENEANIPFWFSEGRDMEGDTLKYYWELYTDSLTTNFTDSTNIYLLHTSGYSVHLYDGGDGVADTLKASLDIDNYGMWWRVFAYDNVDSSEPSRWARFTWDHVDDPPNPFNLIAPIDNFAFKTNLNTVRFNWECNGNPDPSSPGQPDFNLYLAEDPGFTINLKEYTCFPEKVFNPPFVITGHKIVYWRVKANDYTGNSCWSNQVRKLFIDDGSNTAPLKPLLAGPINGGDADLNTLMEWQVSPDNQSDSVFYVLQIDTTATFTSPVIIQNGIFDDIAPVSIRISDLTNNEALTLGRTYYWRVKANDRFINGVSQWSNTWSFTYGTGVGINNQSFEKDIYIYPNPVKSSSLLYMPENLINKGNVEIWNTQGKIMYKGIIKEKNLKIETNHYETGVYFYQITDSSGNSSTGKFIVE